MFRIFFFALGVLFCLVSTGEETLGAGDEPFADLLEKVKPSIVAVGTHYFNDVPKSTYLGTGFVAGKGQWVVTNHHVVAPVIEKKRLKFLRIFHKDLSVKGVEAEIVAEDKFHDLAILQLALERLSPMTLDTKPGNVREGIGVAFTGYPIGLVLGLNPTTHMGIISSVCPLVRPTTFHQIRDRKLVRYLDDPYDVYQVDAVAYPGNSGSPLYRSRTGEVIGVINQVFVKGKKEHVLKEPSGITYAIPVRFVTELMKTIK